MVAGGARSRPTPANAMPLIIDAYNVLHVTGVLPVDLAGPDTMGLVRLIQSSRHGRDRVVLVCDGVPDDNAPRGRHGVVSIRYAGSNRLADDVIVELIDRSSIPRRLLVVSSDREILRAARRRRCRTLTSDRFLAQLAADAGRGAPRANAGRPSGPLAAEEVDRWTREFEVDLAAIEAAPAEPVSDPPPPAAATGRDAVPHSPVPPPALPEDVLREAERLVDRELGSRRRPAERDTMD